MSQSPWSYKPWWCQPWSILLTGVTIIGGAWFVIHTVWATVLVALPIFVWWSYFLILWPRAKADSSSAPDAAATKIQ